ncbi:MAG: hypothetical protein HOJ35_11775 [Bdellovibrionales bacterium]|nr:hypothetical protein [Bdellovibrionales bacterium]
MKRSSIVILVVVFVLSLLSSFTYASDCTAGVDASISEGAQDVSAPSVEESGAEVEQ